MKTKFGALIISIRTKLTTVNNFLGLPRFTTSLPQ